MFSPINPFLTGVGGGTIRSGLDDLRPLAATNNGIYRATDSLYDYIYANGAWTQLSNGDAEHISIGPFTDSNYLIGTAQAGLLANAPKFRNAYTLAVAFYVTSLPGTAGKLLIAQSESTGAFTSGWYMGNSTVNSNKFRMGMAGVNSSAANELSAASAITTGAHVMAVKYNGTNLSYSYDGAAVTNIGTTGTMNQSTAGNPFVIGRWAGTTLACDWSDFIWVRGFASAVADADLQTLSASPSTFLPPYITTAIAYDWQARWFKNGARAWGSETTIDSYVVPIGTLTKTVR